MSFDPTFTIISDGVVNWQEKADELRLAYSDAINGRGALGHRKYVYYEGSWSWRYASGSIPLSGGENLQSESFWYAQHNLFYSNGVTGFTAYYPGPDYWDWDVQGPWPVELLFERIGGELYTDSDNFGFRKCNELDDDGNPIFTRGYFEAGDYIGPWIIEDLINAYYGLVGLWVTFFTPS